MDFPTFSSNIKKNDHTIERLDLSYNMSDCRCWSSFINRETDAIIATYIVNREEYGAHCFDIQYSGGTLIDVQVEDIYDVVDKISRRKPAPVATL